MKKFKKLTELVVPLDRSNIDTDAIIPKQFLKSIKRTGFGKNLFDEWRYLDVGKPDEDCSNRAINNDFVLNVERYKNAKILLVRENFGCGSSREHAPWALKDYGIDVIIGSSFADIFFNNSFKNGLLLITLENIIIDELFKEVISTEGYKLTIDLLAKKIIKQDGTKIKFKIDGFMRNMLLNGLDDIDLTLQHSEKIKNYEKIHKQKSPWLFNVSS